MFRGGNLPLEIELGRFNRPVTPLENRLCKVCKMGVVENECHFAFKCTLYEDLRDDMYTTTAVTVPGLSGMNDYDKLLTLMNDSYLCKKFAQFLINCYNRRALYYKRTNK
jgi:hypothetical protein